MTAVDAGFDRVQHVGIGRGEGRSRGGKQRELFAVGEAVVVGQQLACIEFELQPAQQRRRAGGGGQGGGILAMPGGGGGAARVGLIAGARRGRRRPGQRRPPCISISRRMR